VRSRRDANVRAGCGYFGHGLVAVGARLFRMHRVRKRIALDLQRQRRAVSQLQRQRGIA
jgi:hypothetical protein